MTTERMQRTQSSPSSNETSTKDTNETESAFMRSENLKKGTQAPPEEVEVPSKNDVSHVSKQKKKSKKRSYRKKRRYRRGKKGKTTRKRKGDRGPVFPQGKFLWLFFISPPLPPPKKIPTFLKSADDVKCPYCQ